MKRALPLCIVLALTGIATAGIAAADDQAIKDTRGICQISVPADWKPDSLIKSAAASPDGKKNSVVHAARAGADYQMLTETAKSTYSVSKTVEATPQRTIFVYTNNNGKPGGGVYVATGGSQICNATVDYNDPAFEATAINIAKTVKTVK